jgi:hypothetical protein
MHRLALQSCGGINVQEALMTPQGKHKEPPHHDEGFGSLRLPALQELLC